MPWSDFWTWVIQFVIIAILFLLVAAAVVGIRQAEKQKRKDDR